MPHSDPVPLLIITAHLDKGGLEEVLLMYARLLDQNRWKITFATLNAGTVAQEIEAIPGITLIRISATGRLARLAAMCRVARSTGARIVHNHASWYGLFAGLASGARRIETIHNRYHWLNWHERIRYGLYCRLANRIIAVSRSVADFSRSFFPFFPADRVSVIHNGIMAERFDDSQTRVDIRTKHNIARDSTVIGFVGRLTEQKGVTYLLQAAGAIQSSGFAASVVIVGDGDLDSQLREQALRDGISNVVFAGFQREVADYLKGFDIFVLPSLWEGLPMSVLEAMAAGLPVVATAVSGTPEAVVDGTTGFLVEPRDVPALENRLLRLLSDPALRKQMGAAGRERIRRQFSAQAMVSRTELLYTELLSQ